MRWCQENDLLKSAGQLHCPELTSTGSCKRALTMVKATHDECGYEWRCPTHNDYTRAVCSDSFFANSHLTLRQCLWLIYYWCLDIDLLNAMQMIGIGSKETDVDLYKRMRDLIEQYFADSDVHMQAVETCSSRVKKRLKRKNVMDDNDLLIEHVHEEMWRERFGGNDYDLIWKNFLTLIRLRYPMRSHFE